MGQVLSSNTWPSCSCTWFVVRHHWHSVPQLFHSPAAHARSSTSLQLFGQVGCGGVAAWVGGPTEQVQKAMPCPDCPWSPTCGLAVVESALLTCHLESHHTPVLGAGRVAHCSLRETSLVTMDR